MDTSTIVWIVLAVIVVLAIVAFVVSRSRGRRVEAERNKAAEMRNEAAEHDRRLRAQEAESAETRARAQLAEAEAQKRQLEAERLASEAEDRSQSAEAVRRERDERLRLADKRDPDVRTDKEGFRVDEDGNRIDEDLDTVHGSRDGQTSGRQRDDVTGSNGTSGSNGDATGAGRADPYEQGYAEGRSDAGDDRGSMSPSDRDR
jgi:FtsZ-interacting cell division protein ZipA